MLLDDMNRWYEEEHIPLLQKVPGYLSSIRGSLLWMSSKTSPVVPKYAAFHRFAANSGLNNLQQWKSAFHTEWAERIHKSIDEEGGQTRSEWIYDQTHRA